MAGTNITIDKKLYGILHASEIVVIVAATIIIKKPITVNTNPVCLKLIKMNTEEREGNNEESACYDYCDLRFLRA